jgi:hypothetical protein
LLPSLTSYKHLEHSKRSVCMFCSYDWFSSDYCRDSVLNRPRLLIIVSACPLHSPQSLITSQQIHHHLINKSGHHIPEHWLPEQIQESFGIHHLRKRSRLVIMHKVRHALPYELDTIKGCRLKFG